MYRVGVVGHFAFGKKLTDGQTVKTTTIATELVSHYGLNQVKQIDTYGWRKHPLKLLYMCVVAGFTCRNIVFLSSYKGVRVFIPLFALIGRVMRRKSHYVVIGGWLPSVLGRNGFFRKCVKRIDHVYVETESMLESLQRMGMHNVVLFPNFKNLSILKEALVFASFLEPYPLCTFSRVRKDKGIEDAINAVKEVNEEKGRVVYMLDIYGPIEGEYATRFKDLMDAFPDYIRYRGAVEFGYSVETLRKYFLLLFPTYYEGEGFPGTIIDAFASGIPVVATDWKYNNEIIKSGSDGFVYDTNTNTLKEVLMDVLEMSPSTILQMRKQCISRAREYLPENVMTKLIVRIV